MSIHDSVVIIEDGDCNSRRMAERRITEWPSIPKGIMPFGSSYLMCINEVCPLLDCPYNRSPKAETYRISFYGKMDY